MTIRTEQKQPAWQRVALAGIIASALSIGATAASAGECPADK